MEPRLNVAVAKGSRAGALPAFVSNGMIGLRVREVPLLAGMTIVSGVVGQHPVRRVEASAACPYPLAAELSIDGVGISDQPWDISNIVQSYDFSCGELKSEFTFSVAGKSVDVEVLTFASRTAPTLVLQETTIRPSAKVKLGIHARVETAGLRGRVDARRTDTPGAEKPACDGSFLWWPEGDISQCGFALVTELDTPAERKFDASDASGPLVTSYEVEGAKPVRLRQIVAVVASLAHDRPNEEAVRRVARGKQTGFDELRKRNRDAWAEIWRGRIVVHGAKAEHQDLIDAAFFYLNTSVHGSSLAATSIFGLATWHDYHYYYGHVMWDLDMFCVPPLTFLQPEAARAILDFRSRGLRAAGRVARLSGRQGLQFPWEAAPMSGQEAAPGAGEAAAHEDHGTLHVARAFSLYADITGEANFREERAWPVLSGVAHWICSRVCKTERGYEILRANGPAEVPEPPNNDAFTNIVARLTLEKVVHVAERLGKEISPKWREVAAGLVIPRHADGVIVSHDGFRINEDKGATPSPLVAFFPYDFDCASRDKTIAYYLEHWKEYVGSPMLPALYGVWATMIGDRELALKLFEEGYAKYDSPRFHQCLEYRPDFKDSQVRAGPFFANIGGLLIGLLLGYPGLVVDDGDPSGWARRPVALPSGWRAIEIERLWIRGAPYRLYAEHGADAKLERA